MIKDLKTSVLISEHHLSLRRCWCLVLIKLLAMYPSFDFGHLERGFSFVIIKRFYNCWKQQHYRNQMKRIRKGSSHESGNTPDLGIPIFLHMKFLFAWKIPRFRYFQWILHTFSITSAIFGSRHLELLPSWTSYYNKVFHLKNFSFYLVSFFG